MYRFNVKIFYLLEIILALAGGIILPVYVIYFRNWDITLLEIAILAAVFEATIIVFELPTGLFADRFGRKLSTLAGFALFSLSGLIFYKFTGFVGFLVAEIVFGIAETFISGALEALTVESIPDNEKHNKLSNLFANRSICRTSGLLIGMIAAGLIARSFLEYLFLPVIALGAVGVLSSLFLKESGSKGKAETPVQKPKEHLTKIIFGSGSILALFMVGMLSNFVYEGPDQFWQLLFAEIKNIAPGNFGYLAALGLIIVTISVKFTRKLYDRLTLYIFICFILTALSLFAVSKLVDHPAMVGIIVYFALKEFVRPAISTNLNKHFHSQNRATYLSAYNLTCSIGEVAAGLIAGVLATMYGVEFIFYFSAVFALAVPIIYSAIPKQKKAEPIKAQPFNEK